MNESLDRCFNSQASYSCGELHVSLFVLFSPDFKIENIFFKSKTGPIGREFTELEQNANGRFLWEIFENNGEEENLSSPIFHLPKMLLRNCFNLFRGLESTWQDKCGEPSESLVCRCFGIYRREIEEVINQNLEADLPLIEAKLKAGGGCERCKDDLDDLLEQTQTNPKSFPGVKSSLRVERQVGLWFKYSESFNEFLRHHRLDQSPVHLEKLTTNKEELRIEISLGCDDSIRRDFEFKRKVFEASLEDFIKQDLGHSLHCSIFLLT